MKTSSNKNSYVLDCFSGSGTILKSAHLQNRKWIGIDQSELAIKAIKEKINTIEESLFVSKPEYQDVEVSYPLTAVQETAYEISQIKSLDVQREYFRPLSKNLYKIITKNIPTKPLYLLHCPMAFDNSGADWLSDTKEIQNPYYGKGSKMFTCGTSKVGIARM